MAKRLILRNLRNRRSRSKPTADEP